jgi:hypothetical protein
MNSNESYSVHNLNLLIVVDNTSDVVALMDEYTLSNKVAGDALALLKAMFVSIDGEMLMATTTKLIPIKDYISSEFNRQFNDSLKEQVTRIANEGNLPKALKQNNMFYNEESLKFFDLIFPSALTLSHRKKSTLEFYILPIKMVVPDLTDRTISHIVSLLEDEMEIKNLLGAFKCTDLFQELDSISNHTVSVTPLLADKAISSLREVVSKIRRKQGVKSGKTF